MNLEQMRKRIEEIVAKLEEFNAIENYSTEDVETINTLNEEFEGLKSNIEAKEKIEAMQAAAKKPERKTAPVARVEYKPSKLEENMGFNNLGEFAMAIVNKARGNVDRRFQNTTAYEKFAEDGGVLIPTDFMTSINKDIVMGDQSLMALSDATPVSGNNLSLPIDEEQPWNGGVTTHWIGEGASYTASKPALKSAHWRLHKLGAFVKATEELLDDAPAMESHIRTKAPAAMINTINSAIINGDGVGKPKGILSSGFKIAVAKESGQAADTVVYKNLINMEARMIPGMNAVWIANPGVKPQLRQLKDDNDNHIYMGGGQFPNMAAAPFDTLLGKRIIYMLGSMPALGDEGDIMLVDLNYYKMIFKAGLRQDVSSHLYFDQDITSFKFVQRLDGSCPYSAPVTTEFGSFDLSGFVTLAERA